MKEKLPAQTKRMTALLLCALMLLGLMMPPALAQDYPGQVTGGTVNLRKKPDAKSSSLARYRSGTKLDILEDGEVFCKVKMSDGRIGYMMKEFIEASNGFPPEEQPPIKDQPSQEQAAIRAAAMARGIDPTKPMVALTFDDGPLKHSSNVLKALDAHGAKATFFVIGKNIEEFSNTLKRISDSGHQLAVHAWSHPKYTDISDSAIRSQIQRTADKIFEVTGQKATMMRTTYGHADRRVRRVIAEMGMPIILWRVDSKDWAHRSARRTTNTILGEVKNGDIVLCHDIWESTGQAMETVVPSLIQRGFQLVTVEELLSFRAEPLVPGREYSFLDVGKMALPDTEDKTE